MLSEPLFPAALEKLKGFVATLTLTSSSVGPKPEDSKKWCEWFDKDDGLRKEFPLHYAAMKGELEEIERLIQEGADPAGKMEPWINYSPLHWAAALNQAAALVSLIAAGADPRTVIDVFGRSPRDTAFQQGYDNAVQALDFFAFNLAGGVHAGQGSRRGEYEPNFGIVAFPIVGHPSNGGSYTHPLGCCCYTLSVDHPNTQGAQCCAMASCIPALFTWLLTCFHQPLFTCSGKDSPWYGDCPCSEQPVSHAFAANFPDKVTVGPAKLRFDKGEPNHFFE